MRQVVSRRDPDRLDLRVAAERLQAVGEMAGGASFGVASGRASLERDQGVDLGQRVQAAQYERRGLTGGRVASLVIPASLREAA
jgi:hypothetical protein